MHRNKAVNFHSNWSYLPCRWGFGCGWRRRRWHHRRAAAVLFIGIVHAVFNVITPGEAVYAGAVITLEGKTGTLHVEASFLRFVGPVVAVGLAVAFLVLGDALARLALVLIGSEGENNSLLLRAY